MVRQGWAPDVREIGDRLAALTVAGAAELRDYLEEVHGVRPAGSGEVPPVADEPAPDEGAAEPADLDVLLDGCDPARRVAVIRLVRETTGLGLKEARDLVDSSPRVVRQGLPRADAEKLRAVVEAAGGRVLLRAAAS